MQLREVKIIKYMADNGCLYDNINQAREINFNLYMDKHFPVLPTNNFRSFLIKYYATLIEGLKLLEQNPE